MGFTRQMAREDGRDAALALDAPGASGPVRPAWLRALERGVVAATALLAGAAAARLLGAVETGAGGLAALCGGLAGYALADAVGGVSHWLLDRCIDPRTRWVGPWLVQPFRDHHADPVAIARRGAAEVSSYNCAVVLPLLAALLAPATAPERPLALFAYALALGGLGGVALTNQLHRWAHAARVPRAIAALQRANLILSPVHHARHHRGAHTDHYCVTCGWLNAPLDRARVFARLEALLRRA